MGKQSKPNAVTLACILALALTFMAVPAFGQLEFRDLTAPNLIGDSNVESGAGEGPDAFSIGAQACNIGGNPLRDLFAFVGDGTTPGVFPVTVASGDDFSGSFAIAVMPGENPTRFEGKNQLAPGQCLTFYYQVEYPVVDAMGNAVWGKSNTPADDLALNFTIWGSATDTVTSTVFIDSLPDTVTVRNEITANPNKIQPNPGGFTTFSPDDGMGGPGTIAPGEFITVTFNNVTLGNPNQGFDADMDGNPDVDAWFQPIGESFQDMSGNRYWDPSVFRLVRVDATFEGSGGGCNPAVDTITTIDDWYLDRFDTASSTGGGCSGWDGTYSYTILALKEGVSRISPYQEVASGSENEKYNGDYCGDDFVDIGAGTLDLVNQDPDLICVLLRAGPATNLTLVKDVDKALADPGETLTYTLNFNNVGSGNVGNAVNGIEILDSIPDNSTFVAGSATCSLGACTILFSTDGGTTWTETEPPAASVTDLRWVVNQTVNAGTGGTTGFQVAVDGAFGPGTITNQGNLRIDNGPVLVMDDASTVVGLGLVDVHLFVDTDGNGVQDMGEPDLPGVDVKFTDSGAGMQTITTDANGNASASVPAGTTTCDVVDATVPANHVLTTANDPQMVAAVSGMTVSCTDVGFQPPGTVDVHLFIDTDGNGVQDGGEPDLPGVDVKITDSLGGIQTLTSNGTGDVSVSVPAGNTTLDVVDATVPAGHTLTTANDPQMVNVPGGGAGSGTDIGYQPPATSGTVTVHLFIDTNGNMVQDGVEPDLPGVDVKVTDIGGGMQTLTSSATGDVAASVPAGLTTFDVVDATLPANHALTTANDPQNVTAVAGMTVAGTDIGYRPPATVTVHLFLDNNGNGVQDGVEPDLAGVDVKITDSGAGMQTLTSNATGDVSAIVPPGTATFDVVDATVPANHVLTTANDPQNVTAVSGSTVAGTDIGYQPPGTVTVHLFIDTNGDGAQDLVEPDLSGLDVKFTDSGGGMQTLTTDATGNVSVLVPPGMTTIDVVDATVPAGHVLTTANDPQNVTAAVGSTVAGTDIGYQPRGTLTKHVYQDTNGNGVQDGGEPDLVGVTVNVTDSLGGMQAMMTNATGDVSFDVPAGLASCDVDDASLPPGLVLTTGNDPHMTNVPADGNVGSNVGYQPQGTVTAHLFEDTNGSGVQDMGEPDLAGVDVKVTDSLGGMQTMASNATGDVSATVPAGNTNCDVVDATVPAGFTLTTNNDPPGGALQTVVAVAGTTVAFGDYGYQPGAPVVTASKSSTFTPATGDNDGNGVLSPGDVLSYTVVIENTGPVDAQAVVFNDIPDANTTLAAGSVTTSQGTVTTGNTAGDASVSVDIGTMAVNDMVTVTFDVTINDPLPAGVAQVLNQGDVLGSNFTPIQTDDPNPAGPSDPTLNLIAPPLAIPTLSEWGFLLMILLLAGAAARMLRRREAG